MSNRCEYSGDSCRQCYADTDCRMTLCKACADVAIVERILAVIDSLPYEAKYKRLAAFSYIESAFAGE